MTPMILDILVIAVLLFFALRGATKGFVLTFFNLFSFILALFAANLLHPVVSGALRQSGGLYDYLKSAVSEAIGLEALALPIGRAAETQFIDALSLPSFIKQPLIENNNPEIYNILNASSLEDYIAGFAASLLISAIALLLSFILAIIGIKILAAFLNILAKLPVIHTLNKTGGAVAGLFQGVILIWIVIAAAAVLLTKAEYTEIYRMIEASAAAKYFYENNLILKIILEIFP